MWWRQLLKRVLFLCNQSSPLRIEATTYDADHAFVLECNVCCAFQGLKGLLVKLAANCLDDLCALIYFPPYTYMYFDSHF